MTTATMTRRQLLTGAAGLALGGGLALAAPAVTKPVAASAPATAPAVRDDAAFLAWLKEAPQPFHDWFMDFALAVAEIEERHPEWPEARRMAAHGATAERSLAALLRDNAEVRAWRDSGAAAAWRARRPKLT